MALFFATFGLLTRAFTETIDEASASSVEALRASGAGWLQIVFQAVLPSSVTYILSWTFIRFEINFAVAVAMGAAAKELETTNLSFRRLDINDMLFENEFDLVFSNATIHWVSDHERLLGRCHAALRANGTLRFGFAAKGNTGTLSGVIRDVMQRPDYRDAFASFEWPWFMPTVDEYEKLVRQAGFTDAELWTEDVVRHFETQEQMTGWIDQPVIIPFVRTVPEPLKQAFRDEVVNGMVAAARQPDGRFLETFNRMNLFARKPPARQ